MIQLFNQNKHNEKHNHLNDKDNSIAMMKDWNLNLEQSLRQLRSRINAIENRLSSTQYNTDQSDQQRNQGLSNRSTISEYESIQTLLCQYEQTLDQLEQEYGRINTQLKQLKQKQTSSSLIMHVKGKEIPLEITGIMGGILVMIIAFIVSVGGSGFVISPPFLFSIGTILIGSTLFRSFGGLTYLRSLYEKTL